MKVRKELIENANVIQIATPEERAWAAGYTDCLREIGTMDVDRLRELAEADKAERVVVLPCKVGDTVWFKTYTDNGKTCIGMQSHKAVSVRVCVMADGSIFPVELLLSRFGKSWFLTREEAEKALEAMKDGN